MENNGLIVTTGNQSHGLSIESIGGGGGKVTISTSAKTVDTSASVALGASGGSGGNAGNITIKNNGSINIYGDAGYGIFSKSIGGGGGAVSSTTAVNAVIGSSGGGGNSGDIEITNTSNGTTTKGQNGIGIYALAIGEVAATLAQQGNVFLVQPEE